MWYASDSDDFTRGEVEPSPLYNVPYPTRYVLRYKPTPSYWLFIFALVVLLPVLIILPCTAARPDLGDRNPGVFTFTAFAAGLSVILQLAGTAKLQAWVNGVVLGFISIQSTVSIVSMKSGWGLKLMWVSFGVDLVILTLTELLWVRRTKEATANGTISMKKIMESRV